MRLLLPLLMLAVATAAAARPPALLWQAPQSAPASRWAALVVERDSEGARLIAGRIVEGSVKLKARAPGNGLIFVLRDASGAPLLIGETFDASLVVHGDEPDPATGTLRSLTTRLERTAFPLRVPLMWGARDVALYERVDAGAAPSAADILEAARVGDAGLIPIGLLQLPGAP